MKRKNGFTLIELLAVIVILAIIALIATPIVLNMINSARKKAAESSALGFIDAIEYNNGFAQSEQAGYTEITGTKTVSEINVKMKGKKPTGGEVVIDSNGKVTNATLCFNEYKVTYTPGTTRTEKGTCDGSSSSTPAQTYTAYSVGDSINYNPVTGTINCENPVSTTGTKEGCMKWYVISASGTSDSTVDVILDHNTTAKVAYETSGEYKEYAQASIKTTVDDLVTTNGWQVTPRLITADEVAHIVGADRNDTIKWSSSKEYGTDDIETKSSWFYLDGSGTTYSSSDGWQKQVATSQGASNYKWLFDYTNGCRSYGCNEEDSSTYGYWTSSPVSDYSDRAWRVNDYGNLGRDDVGIVFSFGVRPVITISKSQLS